MTTFFFHGVTLLITHYNRSASLERLLLTLRNLGCRFEEIIVSDDASAPQHLEKLRLMQGVYAFQLITTPVNKGLGNNMNKGQDAVHTPYTLYIQEDFVPSALFPQALADTLQMMNEKQDIDFTRFWSHYKYPTLKPYNKGFSEVKFSFWNMHHLKFYHYSDNPHLRRKSFFEKFGRYREGINGDRTEYLMALSFLRKKGKALFYDNYSSLFTHENPSDEPSTQGRAKWRQSKNIIFLITRAIYLRYRWLKCTMELNFMR